ncbi:MAG: glutathione S-transferase family protein [Cyanobacteria bacterium P01_D01_bin.73]
MVELYQFEFSSYCEKVRLILDYKGIEYRKIDVTPAVGQVDVYRLSGQRQVPVLKDGEQVVADSTAIAKYLDETYPEKSIIPVEVKAKGLSLMMEEWADEAIVPNARKLVLLALRGDTEFRTGWLPSGTPDIVKNIIGSVPGEIFDAVGAGVGVGPDAIASAKRSLHQDLESLCLILSDSAYLTGNEPTLADFSVASASIYLKIPRGNYLNIPANLQGRGIPGIADNPDYAPFFEWRDRLYAEVRSNTPPSDSGSGSGPTPISID